MAIRPTRRRRTQTPAAGCPPPEVRLNGCATVKATRIVEAIDLTQQEVQRADAHASVMPPGGPDADAAGSGFSDTRNLVVKPKDCVVLNTSYEVDFVAVGGCPPYVVEIATSGAVTAQFTNLQRAGKLALATSKIVEGDAFNLRARESLLVDATVRDCADGVGVCKLEIPEP